MAASIAHRFLARKVSYGLTCLYRCPSGFAATALVCQSSHPRVQQIRLKGGRYKAPPTAKEKEKYIPRSSQARSGVKPLTAKELAEFISRVPKDDVWIHRYYPPQYFSFEAALEKHRELASPEMFNNVNGLAFVDLTLDMSTKKKTKFLSPIKGNVLLPHNFDDGVENRVIVIVKNADDQEMAARLGAVFVGGLDIIKKLERGDIAADEYDQVVLNTDLLVEAALIKKVLKDRFPTKKKGNLGSETEAMVRLFVNGRSFASIRDAGAEESTSKLSMAVGRLNMPTNELVDNVKAVFEAICSHKAAHMGPPLIRDIRLACPPSTESFYVRDAALLPAVSVSQQKVSREVVEQEDDDEEEEAEEKLTVTAKS